MNIQRVAFGGSSLIFWKDFAKLKQERPSQMEEFVTDSTSHKPRGQSRASTVLFDDAPLLTHITTMGVQYRDDLIVAQRSTNGHVWYLPAYMRVCVRLSRTSDWERLVHRLLEIEADRRT
jgi:hypothetical protein